MSKRTRSAVKSWLCRLNIGAWPSSRGRAAQEGGHAQDSPVGTAFSGPRSLPRSDRQLDERGAAEDLARHRAADGARAEQPVDFVDALDRGAIQADEDVPRLQAGAIGWLSRHPLHQLDAGPLRDRVVAREPPIEGTRLRGQAQDAAPDAAVLHQLAQHPAGGVDRDGEAEP